MADRVLSTATARDSIQKFGNLVNGSLLEQITSLNREGQTLSQPDVWDGRLASEFRGNWKETNAALMKMKGALEELRSKINQINQNIMQAGGNS